MKHGINKVILVGNLGSDPEFKQLPNSELCNFSVATSESWSDKTTGEKKEKTEWHRVVIFGKLAGIANQYLKKGSKVYLEGSLQTRKWQDQSGADRYSTEIVANEMQMLDSRNSGDTGPQPSHPQSSAQQYRDAQNGTSKVAPAQGGDFDDDIPF